MRKVVLFIATSLDGLIAGPDGDIGWLSLVEKAGEDYGYSAFIDTVDTVVMGRKTYDKVLGFGIPFPHRDRECFIISRQPRKSEGNLHFAPDPVALVRTLKEKPGKNIFIDGGAQLVQELMRHRLIDVYILSIIPVFLGRGVRLFDGERPGENLRLERVLSFDTGLVQLHYNAIDSSSIP